MKALVGLIVYVGAIFLLGWIFRESWNYAFVEGIASGKLNKIDYWHALVAMIFLTLFVSAAAVVPRLLVK